MNNLPGYFTQVENFINFDSNLLNNLKLGELITSFNGAGTVLEYYIIENIDSIWPLHTRIFCNIAPTYIMYAQLTGKGILGGHIDHGPLVTLNVYLEANEDFTYFYKKPENSIGHVYPGKESANIFDIKELEMVGGFSAKSNQSYLLNVSEIHSVEKKSVSRRSFIGYMWHHNTYEEVLANLC